MSSMISTPSDVTPSKITFGPVKLLDNGGKTVNVSYETRGLIIETPSLNVPYGVNVFDKTPGAPPKYSVDLSLRGADENESVRAFQEFVEAFDERMIDAGVENAGKWFKMANPNREVIKAFYTPLLKVSRDPQGNLKPYPPTVKLSLRKKTVATKPGGPRTMMDPTSTKLNTFEAELYDPATKDDKGRITLFPGTSDVDQVLVKRSQVSAIMQCTGVWFAGGKFGTTWKATQFRVDSQPEQIRGPAFRSEAPDIRAFVSKKVAAEAAEAEEDEGEEEAESVVAAVLPAAGKKAPEPPAAAAFEEEAVAEPVPVPKKTVKKVVTKVAGK